MLERRPRLLSVRDTLLRSGRVIDPSTRMDAVADLLIQGGKIAAIGPEISVGPDAEVLAVDGLVVCPGFVDLHTHLRFPGQPEKETVASGTRAAAAGGYTAICAMANTSPTVDRAEVLNEVYAEAARTAVVRVFQFAAVSIGLQGDLATDMESLARAGAVGFSDDGKPVWNAELMADALRRAGALNKILSAHEEDPAIVAGGVANAGDAARRHGLKAWPCSGESSLVARDIELLRTHGGRLHIAHVSCAETVDILRKVRAEGLPVTAEVTPHHLRLTDDLLDGDLELRLPAAHPCCKVNPPLRTADDAEAMVAALAEGVIDTIATDHAPHTEADKAGLFADAAFGFSMIESALPLVLDLVRAGRMDLPTVIRRMSTAPAEIVGLEAGTLRAGAAADICVFDPDEPWFLRPETMHSRGKNSPLLGAELRGRVKWTIVGGEVVYEA
jgi:dihydroorotase